MQLVQRRRRKKRRGREKRRVSALVAAPLFALLTVTFAFLELIDPMVLGETVVDLGFESDLSRWTVSDPDQITLGDDALLVLHNQQSEETISMYREITLSEKVGAVRLSAVASAIEISKSLRSWESGRVHLAQLDQSGHPIWKRPHILFELTGNVAENRYSKDFAIPKEGSTVRLGVWLSKASGILKVSDLRLNVLQPSRVYGLPYITLIFLWIVATIYYGVRVLVRFKPGRLRTFTIASIIMICVGLFAPGKYSEHYVDRLSHYTSIDAFILELTTHVIGFAVLVFCFRLGIPRGDNLVHLICWILVAASTEVLQTFGGRQPQLQDWIADCLGIAAGLLFSSMFVRWLRKSRHG